MSRRALIGLGLPLFLLTVLLRLPASWVSSRLPADMHCDFPEGTVWRGSCGQLRFDAVSLSEPHWQLLALQLLRLRLAARLTCNDPRAMGNADVALGFGHALYLRNVAVDLPVDGGLVPWFPDDWSGQLHVELASADLQGGRLVAARGTLTARSLRGAYGQSELGSYALKFLEPGPDGQIRAELKDLGGPLQLQGQLQLRRDGNYELNGHVLARAQASDDLQHWMQLLGPPDPLGMRPFSLGGVL
ncbi:MAG TPA: type II secretion system protein N [Steroidobacteraceae bacterium]